MVSDEIVQKLCTSLQSDDRKIRKKTFEDFRKHISNQENFAVEEHHKIFSETHIFVLNGLRDKCEPVREEAIKFVQTFIIDILPKNDYYLSYVVPVLTERLGSVEIIEESEEIRLQLVILLEAIIEKYQQGNQLNPFLNDMAIILGQTVTDKFPAVKEKSCHCIIKLANALPRDFHLQAETLVKPVLTNFSHQRYKIRCVAITCIGEIVLLSTHKALDEVVGPMAERLFDQIAVVRRTVAQVAAKWLREYRDRYSFLHKLLPLILTGLNDEIQETRDEANELWALIGIQYQQENEQDLKDQMDYLIDHPKHYIKDVKRPNLGCRVLVQRNVSKLAKALSTELCSWQADIRVRCSQLLCSVVLHAEEAITHNLQDLLPAMYMGARDEDKLVSENVIRAAEIVGLFVPVDTWKQIILPVVDDSAHYGHLAVLAALIRGSPTEYIAKHLQEILHLLADKTVCQSRKMKYQRELINCANAVMEKCDSIDLTQIGKHLFTILLTVIALKNIDDVQTDISLLDKLRTALKLNTTQELWSMYTKDVLEQLNSDPKGWTTVTAERSVFELILKESGSAFGENLKLLGEVLCETLTVDADAESRLKLFMALSQAMDAKTVIFENCHDDLNGFLEILVTEIFVPTLVWHAGRTAEAMRTMAASCLFSALSPSEGVYLFEDVEILRSLIDKLLPLLISLTQDASHWSRQLALKDIVLLKGVASCRHIWTADDLIKVYPEILKRLDDPNDKVRRCAVESLTVLLDKPPQEFCKDTYRSHHGFLVDTLLIHFDDEDEDFQCLVSDGLKIISSVCRETVKEKIEKQKTLVRNRKGCDEILSYLCNAETQNN